MPNPWLQKKCIPGAKLFFARSPFNPAFTLGNGNQLEGGKNPSAFPSEIVIIGMLWRGIRVARADTGVANRGEMEAPGIFAGTSREIFEVTFDRYLYASERRLHASARANAAPNGRINLRVSPSSVLFASDSSESKGKRWM